MRLYGPDEFELPYTERDLRLARRRVALRYPGGKTRALGDIVPLVPFFEEYREPFIGGGSVFVSLRQICRERRRRTRGKRRAFRINDLNEDVYCFWKVLRDDAAGLAREIRRLKREWRDGRALFGELRETSPETELGRAARFFVLNRISFSGLADSGGYSAYSFERRFTESSIRRVERLGPLLAGVEILNGDYEDLLLKGGEGVFIFLDPPYLGNKGSRLYGKGGELHATFDHRRLARALRRCEHKWLLTIDDTPESRELFSFGHISEWELQYGMNNYGSDTAESGRELFVSNYDLAGWRKRHGQLTLDRFFS
jgi:DNA adenine methylase